VGRFLRHGVDVFDGTTLLV